MLAVAMLLIVAQIELHDKSAASVMTPQVVSGSDDGDLLPCLSMHPLKTFGSSAPCTVSECF
jgi:hypothetical protein